MAYGSMIFFQREEKVPVVKISPLLPPSPPLPPPPPPPLPLFLHPTRIDQNRNAFAGVCSVKTTIGPFFWFFFFFFIQQSLVNIHRLDTGFVTPGQNLFGFEGNSIPYRYCRRRAHSDPERPNFFRNQRADKLSRDKGKRFSWVTNGLDMDKRGQKQNTIGDSCGEEH